jgi:hypothetical protein
LFYAVKVLGSSGRAADLLMHKKRGQLTPYRVYVTDKI